MPSNQITSYESTSLPNLAGKHFAHQLCDPLVPCDSDDVVEATRVLIFGTKRIPSIKPVHVCGQAGRVCKPEAGRNAEPGRNVEAGNPRTLKKLDLKVFKLSAHPQEHKDLNQTPQALKVGAAAQDQ